MKKISTKTTSLFAVTLAALLVTGCFPDDPKDQGDDNDDQGELDFYEEKGWQLVFADEFDGTVIDDSKWAFEVNCWGGGNNEAQCYVDDPENAYVENGVLNIKAIREAVTGPISNPDSPDYDPANTNDKTFSSARLRSVSPYAYSQGEGFNFRHDWTYGRVEIRAKVPAGQGTWAAAWMLPTDWEFGGWAMSGEIDILEAVNIGAQSDADDAVEGQPENRVYGTLHYGRAWPGNVYSGESYTAIADPSADFHTYTIEWEEGAIRWFVDDVHYATQTQEGWYTHYQDENGVWQSSGATAAPFNQDFHIILNLAMGGDWAGGVNEGGISDSINEALYQIDYVRVYQCEDDVTGVACGTKGEEGTYTLQSGVVEPMLPVAADFNADPLVIFDDILVADWQLAKWDGADGGDEYSVVEPTDTTDGYIDLQFDNTGVMYLYSNEGKVDNFSNFAGDYSFDIRWVDGTATALKVGINDDKGNFAYVELAQSNFGSSGASDWTTVTIPVADMLANAPNINMNRINIAGKFEQVGGTDLHVQIRNIKISQGQLPVALSVFSDAINADWVAWDCCAGSTPSVVTDADAAYGNVAQFDINGATVVGFNARSDVGSTGDKLFDASNGSTLEFDLKMVAAPTAGSTSWMLKLESKGAATFAEVNLNTSVEGQVPVLGEWQHYTFSIPDLKAAGLDVSKIDLIMVYPVWGTGTGASFYIDNVNFYGGSEIENVSLEPTSGALIVSDGTFTPTWSKYASSGNAAIEEATDSDATYGDVISFTYHWTDAIGGLTSNVSGATHDATLNSTLEFDLKLISHTDFGDPGYWLKVEGNNGAVAEVGLGDSVEAHTPIVDTWQHYTFSMSDLISAGLTDVSEIHTIMIFPSWLFGSDEGQGSGTKFVVDNVEFK